MEGICMFIINRKGFLRFLPGFCVIIFAYMESVSFGVTEILKMKHNLPQVFVHQKTYFKNPESVAALSDELTSHV